MPVDSTHQDYDLRAGEWSRARDVLSGEDAVKAGGERYLSRLEGMSDEEYGAYRDRASFFNATARTAEGYSGLIFRRPPFVKSPDASSAAGAAMERFINEADMLANSRVGQPQTIVQRFKESAS